MTANWTDVSSSDLYQNLSIVDRLAVKQDFFDRTIKPELGKDQVDSVHADFMSRNQDKDYAGLDHETAAKANAIKSGVANGTMSPEQGLRALNEVVKLPGAEHFLASDYQIPQASEPFAFREDVASGLHQTNALATLAGAAVVGSAEQRAAEYEQRMGNPAPQEGGLQEQMFAHATQQFQAAQEQAVPSTTTQPLWGVPAEVAAGTVSAGGMVTAAAAAEKRVTDTGGSAWQEGFQGALATVLTAAQVKGMSGAAGAVENKLAQAGAGATTRVIGKALGGAAGSAAVGTTGQEISNLAAPENLQNPITPATIASQAGMGLLAGLEPGAGNVPFEKQAFSQASKQFQRYGKTSAYQTPSSDLITADDWNKATPEQRLAWKKPPETTVPPPPPPPAAPPPPEHPEDKEIARLKEAQSSAESDLAKKDYDKQIKDQEKIKADRLAEEARQAEVKKATADAAAAADRGDYASRDRILKAAEKLGPIPTEEGGEGIEVGHPPDETTTLEKAPVTEPEPSPPSIRGIEVGEEKPIELTGDELEHFPEGHDPKVLATLVDLAARDPETLDRLAQEHATDEDAFTRAAIKASATRPQAEAPAGGGEGGAGAAGAEAGQGGEAGGAATAAEAHAVAQAEVAPTKDGVEPEPPKRLPIDNTRDIPTLGALNKDHTKALVDKSVPKYAVADPKTGEILMATDSAKSALLAARDGGTVIHPQEIVAQAHEAPEGARLEAGEPYDAAHGNDKTGATKYENDYFQERYGIDPKAKGGWQDWINDLARKKLEQANRGELKDIPVDELDPAQQVGENGKWLENPRYASDQVGKQESSGKEHQEGNAGGQAAEAGGGNRSGNTTEGKENWPKLVKFRRSKDDDNYKGKRLSHEEVQSLVDRITAKWKNAGKIKVLPNIWHPEVPEWAQAAELAHRKAGGEGSTNGFYDPNTETTYIFSDRTSTPKKVLTTVAHEILGHRGIQGFFEGYLDSTLDRIANLRPGKLKELAESGERKLDLKIPAQRRLAAEELLAHLAETQPAYGPLRKAYATIRTYLREKGFNLGYSDSEIIRDFILPAREFSKEGIGAKEAGATAKGNGAPFHRSQEQTPEFKKWFGESKVVDESGQPKVMYHGTSKDQDFSTFKAGQRGVWFTDNPKGASDYAHSNDARQTLTAIRENKHTAERVMPVYLSIKNPYHLTAEDIEQSKFAKSYVLQQRQMMAKAAYLGHDGVDFGGGTWVAFKPEQIKSAIGNRGTFEAGNTSVLFHRTPDDEDFVPPEAAKSVGLSHLSNQVTREQLGLRDAPEAERIKWAKIVNDTQPKSVEDLNRQKALYDELRANPKRAVNAEEKADLLSMQVQLHRLRDSLEYKIQQAWDSGDASQQPFLMAQLAQNRQNLADLLDVTHRAGTVSGQALAFQNVRMNLDFSLGTMENRIKIAKRGVELTDAEYAKVKALHNELQEARQTTSQHRGALSTNFEASGNKTNFLANLVREFKDPYRAVAELSSAKPETLQRAWKSVQSKHPELGLPEFDPAKAQQAADTFAPDEAESQAKINDIQARFLRMEEHTANPVRWFSADMFQRYRVASLISSPFIYAKLVAAAMARTVLTPAEELAGSVLRKVPGISKVAAKAPMHGRGFDPEAEWAALQSFYQHGLSDAKQTIMKGQTDLESVIGKQKQPFGGLDRLKEDLTGAERASVLLNLIPTSHAALKAPILRADFARRCVQLSKSVVEASGDPTDPITRLSIENQAYQEAMRSIFKQRNWWVDNYQGALKRWQQSGDWGKKAVAVAAQAIAPIVRIPTNIAAETAEYILGPAAHLQTSARVLSALRTGIETLSPEDADVFMRSLTKGALGISAMVFLGYRNPQWFHGFYRQGHYDPKKPPMGANFDGKEISPTLMHGPAFNAIAFGSTMAQSTHEQLAKVPDDKTGAMLHGMADSAYGFSQEIPFVEQMTSMSKIADPRQRGKWLDEFGSNLVMPQAMTAIAKHYDKDAEGNTVLRDPKSFLQYLQASIPGHGVGPLKGREDLPEKRR